MQDAELRQPEGEEKDALDMVDESAVELEELREVKKIHPLRGDVIHENDVDPFLPDAVSIMRELWRCRQEVEIAQKQFDAAVDPLLVDHAVLRLGAAEKRMNYLFQLARKMRLSVKGIGWERYDAMNS